jgi:hypothetical protein
MNAKRYQAWARAIICLIVAMACFVLAKGFPLAFWFGVFWLVISITSAIVAIRGSDQVPGRGFRG